MNDNTFDTDVLVVGTGPMGSATALALATYGVRVHLVNRFNWLANSPRAHITNQRTVEVLRDLGVEDEAARYATPWELMGDTLFTTSLAGEEIGRVRTWGTGEDRNGDYLKLRAFEGRFDDGTAYGPRVDSGQRRVSAARRGRHRRSRVARRGFR